MGQGRCKFSWRIVSNGHDEDLVIFDWDSLKENISKAKQSTAVTGGALREYNNWFGRLSPDIFQTVW